MRKWFAQFNERCHWSFHVAGQPTQGIKWGGLKETRNATTKAWEEAQVTTETGHPIEDHIWYQQEERCVYHHSPASSARCGSF